MLLFFRFLFSTLLGILRPRIAATEESVTRFTVLPNDCDLNIHLNAGRFVSFMDCGRMDLIARTRLLGPLLKRRLRPIMGGIVVRYRRSILPFRRFSIRSRVIGWDAKWIYVEHIVERQRLVHAHAYVRTLIRGDSGNVTPAEVLALVGQQDIASPQLPEFVSQWCALEDQR
jgi:acyl-CoA thioesterase FadM